MKELYTDADEALNELVGALLAIKSEVDMVRFLKDLSTPRELAALAERWRVCQLLERGDLSYRDIHAMTGASLVTIGRVARFLKHEPHKGYQLVLKKLRTNQEKT